MPDTEIEIERLGNILTTNTTLETEAQRIDNPEVQLEVFHSDAVRFIERIFHLNVPAIFSAINSVFNSEAPSRPLRLDVNSRLEVFILIACIMTIFFVISVILINNRVFNYIYFSLCLIALIPPLFFAIKGRLTNEISIRWVCCYLAVIIYFALCIILFMFASENRQKINKKV